MSEATARLPFEPYAYTDDQVARFLHKPLSTVQAMLRSGEIPGKKVGRTWVVPRKRFEEWLNDVS